MQKRQKTKQKKHWLSKILFGLAILISLGMLFNGPIRSQVVKYMTLRQQKDLTAQQIEKNNQKKGDFDFKKVTSLDNKSVAKALVWGDVAVLGKIAIPSVEMYLPIMKGISEPVLMQGGGTMKADQKMGAENNYALAGHSQPFIFLPISETKLGDKIYITDLKKIYTYKITVKRSIDPHETSVIDDVAGKKMITLITCDKHVRRWCVQGELTATKKATTKNLEIFK